jgi:arabinofuranosyltransferase
MSLAAGLATGGLALVWLRRITLRAPEGRLLLAATAMLGIATNRTLLTWNSSGLETGLFNLLVVSWAFLATDRRLRGPTLALVAALLTLTRPDGLLYSAVTVMILASRLPIRRALLGASPMLLVGAHLIWRRATYGHWLPNTYTAKVSQPWPEAGIRYLGAFLLEHGLWLAAPLLVAGAVLAMRDEGRRDTAFRIGLPAGTLLAHVAYYTLRVGGDHFEYRVLSHLVVPIFVGCAWAADRMLSRRAPALVLLIVGASWPLAWTHHALGRHLTTRAQTDALFLPVAPLLPPPLSSLAAVHDDNQRWLIERYIARRHREHVVFRDHLERTLAQPAEVTRLDWEAQRPIASARSVGVVGWRLHQAAILDELGLNDRVIARGPLRHSDGSTRRMAHDRQPPPGYLECFRQNLTKDAEGLTTDPAIEPMSDTEIRDCETRFLPK